MFQQNTYHNVTVFHHDDAITIYDGVQTMRYRNNSAVFKGLSYCVLNYVIGAKNGNIILK